MVNNAYGLQCSKITNDLNQAHKQGRLDVLISSTDKNFMVPVGGSIVYGPQKKHLIEKINKFYPGRASTGPLMDLFLTFLQMGENNLRRLLAERKQNYAYLKEQLQGVAAKHNERVLETPGNKISIACTLTALNNSVFKPNGIKATYFGSYLFSRRVSGVRVIDSSEGKLQSIASPEGCQFLNYGSHCNDYPALPFFTAAAAIGQTKAEIDLFIGRLDDAFTKFRAQQPDVMADIGIQLGPAIQEQEESKQDQSAAASEP